MGGISSIGRRLWCLVAVGRGVGLGHRVHVGFGSRLWAPHCMTVGDDVYVGRYRTIECDGSIGAGTLIANNVGIVGRDDHDFRRVGTPVSRTPWIGDRPSGRRDRVIIGADVWLGFGTVVLSGVEIGRGAIVAAGSVVAHNIAPYDVVGGAPARVLGRRFTDAEIEKHEALIAGDEPHPHSGAV